MDWSRATPEFREMSLLDIIFIQMAPWSTMYNYKQVVDNNYTFNFFLSGDSGYPLEPWLMTPLNNATTPAETRYNRAHCKTRNIVEGSFGLLKSRFRCLSQSGGTLLYTPEKVCKIVVAVAVLHNFCIRRGIANTEDDVQNENFEDDITDNTPAAWNKYFNSYITFQFIYIFNSYITLLNGYYIHNKK